MLIKKKHSNFKELSKDKVLTKDDALTISFLDPSMSYDIWQNSLDEDVRKFVPDEVFETLEIAQEVVSSLIESYENDEGPFIFPIIRNSDQANIGYVQLVLINEGWEIGYHIAKKYTGNGYATKAVSLFISYLKENTDLREIYGVALFDNLASRKVLEKAGFELFFIGDDLYQGETKKIIKSIKRL